MNIRIHPLNLTRCGISALAAVSVAAWAADEPPNAGALYRAHKAAVSRGDADAAMAFLSDDVRYVAGPNCPPTQPCVGKDAVRKGFVDYAVSTKMTIVPVGASQRGAQGTRTQVEVRWAGIDQLGVERLRGFDDVTLRNDKIQSIIFEPDLSDAQTRKVYRPPAAAAAKAP